MISDCYLWGVSRQLNLAIVMRCTFSVYRTLRLANSTLGQRGRRSYSIFDEWSSFAHCRTAPTRTDCDRASTGHAALLRRQNVLSLGRTRTCLWLYTGILRCP